jgi:hypothetical protein
VAVPAETGTGARYYMVHRGSVGLYQSVSQYPYNVLVWGAGGTNVEEPGINMEDC